MKHIAGEAVAIRCSRSGCPVNECTTGTCALGRYVREFPHIVIDFRDDPEACKRLRAAAKKLEEMEASK